MTASRQQTCTGGLVFGVMGDAHAQLMIVTQSTIGAVMRILPNQSERRKVIGLTRGRRLLRTSGWHEGIPYNIVILRHIHGFLVYINGSI